MNKVRRVTCDGARIESLNGVIKAPAEGIWMGCKVENSVVLTSTAIEHAYVIHPALWYWPVELYVLFLGDKGRFH